MSDKEMHLGDSIIQYFGVGTVVDVYFSETSGTTYYDQNDVEQKAFLTGKIVCAIGKGLVIEVDASTARKKIVKEVMINDWAITGVMRSDGDGIHITHVFNEVKR